MRLDAQGAEEGLETVDLTSLITNNFGQWGEWRTANSGAVGLQTVHFDTGQQTLIDAWPDLPEDTKEAILELGKSTARCETSRQARTRRVCVARFEIHPHPCESRCSVD